MYHQKRICIYVLLLFCLNQISAIQIPCTSDSDCSGGQGVCTAIGLSSYCSCLSGFGGASCDERPDAACAGSFGAVSDTASSLQTSSSLSYQYPNLTLSVTANLEESKYAFPAENNTLNIVPFSEELSIIFGNGSFTDCDFPNNNTDWRDLAASSGDCNDQYSLTLAFTDAKSKCGFADNNGDRIFQQVIHINRKYKLQSLRGQAVSRIDTSVRTLRLIFPHEVSVSTSSVQVVGSPSLLAAITLIDFDPSPELWAVQATTSIQSPFKLTNPLVVASSGPISTYSRFQTGSESVSVVSGCGNNTQDCYQKVSLGFVAGTATDACYGLTGSVTVRLNVTCSESNATACPLLGGETVEVILTLSTSDACPVTEEIQFTTASLASYSNAGASNARSAFMTNQIAYFGANVQAADTLITDRRVKNNSVCFKIGAAACQPVAFTEISAAGGKDPVFSVDFSDAANAGVFGFLDSASASSQLFSVYATIEVDFSGVSKSMSLKKQHAGQGSREVELSTTVKLESFLNSDAGTAAPSMVIMITLFVLGMLL